MGFLGGGVALHPLPSRQGDLGERRELPQRGPGRSPGRQRILGIFQGLRILLVETMHYGTNQKFRGAWARFGGPVPPWPQPKTATVCTCNQKVEIIITTRLRSAITSACYSSEQLHSQFNDFLLLLLLLMMMHQRARSLSSSSSSLCHAPTSPVLSINIVHRASCSYDQSSSTSLLDIGLRCSLSL